MEHLKPSSYSTAYAGGGGKNATPYRIFFFRFFLPPPPARLSQWDSEVCVREARTKSQAPTSKHNHRGGGGGEKKEKKTPIGGGAFFFCPPPPRPRSESPSWIVDYWGKDSYE